MTIVYLFFKGPDDVFSQNKSNTESKQDCPKEVMRDKSQFFGHPVFLTVSGQLHLEAITGYVCNSILDTVIWKVKDL